MCELCTDAFRRPAVSHASTTEALAERRPRCANVTSEPSGRRESSTSGSSGDESLRPLARWRDLVTPPRPHRIRESRNQRIVTRSAWHIWASVIRPSRRVYRPAIGASSWVPPTDSARRRQMATTRSPASMNVGLSTFLIPADRHQVRGPAPHCADRSGGNRGTPRHTATTRSARESRSPRHIALALPLRLPARWHGTTRVWCRHSPVT